MNAFVKLRQKISPYLFLVPCLIVFGLFLFYPFAKTIYLSLYKTDKLGQAKLFVGFGNYIDLFTSESFYNSLLVTLIFVVIVVMVSMLLGLVTALLVFVLIGNGMRGWVVGLIVFVLIINLIGMLPLVQELRKQRKLLKEILDQEE